MTVEVKNSDTFEPGPAKLLFETWIRGPLSEYDMTRDGQKFVMLAPEEGVISTPATVLLNWKSALKALK